jgi:hypothetical protein
MYAPVHYAGNSTPAAEAPQSVVDKRATSNRSEAVAVTILKKCFSFPAMLGGLLVVGTFVARRDFQVDPDLWWHLKVGEDILATHRWPTSDPYSFTVAGQPWLAFEWLGDVLIAAVARAAGLPGLQALLVVLSSAIIVAIYCYATLRSKNSKASFLVSGVLLLLAVSNFNLRPQMLGYLFLVLTLIALERCRQGKPKALWCLPVLSLVWINAHGSWEIGLGVILVYWLCGLGQFRLGDLEMRPWNWKGRIQLSGVLLLCLAMIPITPYGIRLAAFPFQVATSYPLSHLYVQEWQPISMDGLGPKILLTLVLGTIAMQVAFRFKWRIEDLLLFLGATVLTFTHVRFLLLFVPFFAPIFATMLSDWVPRYHQEKDPYIVNAVLMGLMLSAIIHFFPSGREVEENVAAHFPVAAVKYLAAHPVPGPMFNAYGFGGYLVYSRGNTHKVFIDGRSEVYEDGGVFTDYFYISRIKPGLLSVMRHYGIESCLLGRDDPLAVFLEHLPDWKQVYADRVSVILVRTDNLPSTAALSP